MADANDWTAWLDRHGNTLLLLARQWTSSTTDAADVVQEGFLRFWRSRHEVTDPTGYLYICLKRCAIDLHRADQRRRRREQVVARDESTEGWFASQGQDDARVLEIQAALEHLPPEQREVLTMKTWGGLTFEQIGAALGLSPHTAASRYRYGLEKLRTVLGANPRKEKESVR